MRNASETMSQPGAVKHGNACCCYRYPFWLPTLPLGLTAPEIPGLGARKPVEGLLVEPAAVEPAAMA
jgi:hypothetical protein